MFDHISKPLQVRQNTPLRAVFSTLYSVFGNVVKHGLYIENSIFVVTPQYLWTVQKIFNSRIHGSNPIATHGNVKSVDGGLQLNGVDAWLDAGDYYGQCLGDPDLCIKGFSFALQVLNPVIYCRLCRNVRC